MLKYAMYCSGNATTINKFYNLNPHLYPEIIIYDGNKANVIEKMKLKFKDRLILIEHDKLSPKDLSRINNYTSEFIHKQLDKYKIDYLLCTGSRILKKKLIDAYPKRLINFHPSILPAFKGLKSIDRAIEYKSCFLGCSAIYINYGIDTGEIICQICTKRSEFKNYSNIIDLQHPLIKIVLKYLLKYNISDSDIECDIKINKKNYLISHNFDK